MPDVWCVNDGCPLSGGVTSAAATTSGVTSGAGVVVVETVSSPVLLSAFRTTKRFLEEELLLRWRCMVLPMDRFLVLWTPSETQRNCSDGRFVNLSVMLLKGNPAERIRMEGVIGTVSEDGDAVLATVSILTALTWFTRLAPKSPIEIL